MHLSLKSTAFRIDLLTLLFPLLAAMLGEGLTVCLLLPSLAAHELAHLAVARCVRADIHSVRLTPFGGMIQLKKTYILPPIRLIAISAAGPAANFLLILSAASLCHWNLLSPVPALEFIRINTVLLLFNLFPALPLDGGRILWALLSTRLSRERAMSVSVICSRFLAGLLVFMAAVGFVLHHQLNLSLLFATVFLLISGKDDREALQNSRADALLNGIRPLTEPVSAELIAVDASASPREALLAVRAGRRPLFAVYSHGRLQQIVDEQTLLDLLTINTTESRA